MASNASSASPHADARNDALDPQADVQIDIDALLGLETHQAQMVWLRQHALLNDAGLAQVLDEAEQSVGRDPGQARRLAELVDACSRISEVGLQAGLDLHARASYIRAQTHYRNAEFDAALQLIQVAHAAYQSLGNHFEALRVNLGSIAVFSEQGNYAAALEVGRDLILQAAALQPDERFEVTADDIAQLLAKASLNCGACYELKGDYDAALQSFAEAEARYNALGLDELTADIQLNRGVVLLKLGLGAPALAAFEEAHHRFSAAGLTLKDAWALLNAADAHLMLGQYTQSLQRFAEARRSIEPLEASADKPVLLLDAADAYLDLNLFAEAGAAYREAITALRAVGMTHDLARAQLGLGTALMAQADDAAAEPALDEAAAIFQSGENIPMQVQVRLQQAALQRQQGHIEAAQQLAQQALDLTWQGKWPLQQVEAHLALAELALLTGSADVTQAESHLATAQALAEPLNLPSVWLRLHTLLGRMHLQHDALDAAEGALLSAVRETETLRSTLLSERMRASFVDSRLSAYDALIELYLRRAEQHNDLNAVERAFEMSERAKSRALVDRLSGGFAGPASPSLDPATQQHARQLQRELEDCYSELMSASLQDGTAASVDEMAALQARALALEQEINQLELAASNAPASSPALEAQNGVVLDAASTRAQLPANTTLISYTSRGDELIAFVVRADALTFTRNIGHISAVQAHLRQLDVQWQRVQSNPQAMARHLPQLTRSAQTVLRGLFAELIEALRPAFSPAPTDAVHSLVIVPHGPLHHVPFHALFDGERYLIDDFEISYAPSGTVFAQCQQRAPASAPASAPAQPHDLGRALVVGVADPLIPSAVEEAVAVAHTLGEKVTVLTGDLATVDRVEAQTRESETAHDLVHLACHGLFRADNPMFSALRLADGWLMAADIARFNLRGACVVYSACESGRNRVSRGDEVYGLVRAALSAGATSVMASLWLVHDQTTATLMQAWYDALQRGEGRPRALRAAQQRVRAAQPHPYFWAPFVCIGRVS